MRLVKITAIAAAIVAIGFAPVAAQIETPPPTTTTTAEATTTSAAPTTTEAPPATTEAPEEEDVRPLVLTGQIEVKVDHRSGGITTTKTRIYVGTDKGTIEEWDSDLNFLEARDSFSAMVSGTLTSVTFSDSSNRLGGFTAMDDIENDVFYFCSEDDNGVYRYATETDTMTRIVGNGDEGLQAGTGTDARIDCGADAMSGARNSERTKIFMFSGSSNADTWGIVQILADAETPADEGVMTILAGSGTEGHADGTGTDAQFRQTHGMIYFENKDNGFLILGGSDDEGSIRFINIDSKEVATSAIVWSESDHTSGSDGDAVAPNVLGLVGYPGKPFGYGVTADRVFTLSWSTAVDSFRIDFGESTVADQWCAAMVPDGSRLLLGNSIDGEGHLVSFDLVSADSTTEPSDTTPAPNQTLDATAGTSLTPLLAAAAFGLALVVTW